MQVPGLQVVDEVHELLRAADVERLVDLVRRGHVVDRRQVEDVVDLPAMLGDPRLVDPELHRLQVAGHRVHAALRAPALDQSVEPLARALADEHVDLAAALQQALDQVAPDEARGSRDEVRGVVPLHGGAPYPAGVVGATRRCYLRVTP